ncbi:ABC transporter permease [Nocardioides ferulae]|uniref:ABC transporter permease n=1 Tax=Nocardioides ferulae TaxID=2340821 RepID=UPI000EB2A773|nr:ABC transporter permease [Nocardioides ferulae]
MSTSSTQPAATPEPLDIDVMHAPKIPFWRLVSVELRKMADTRAGLWLLITIGVLTAAIVVIFFFAADDSELTFYNFLGATTTPQGFLLPVLGILLVTSEWSQRTTLTTFTLEPSRTRIVAAKTAAAVAFGLVAIAVAVVVAWLAAFLGGTDDAFRDVGLEDFSRFALLQIIAIVWGLAFGLLFLNSPAAIVLYFVVPIAFNVLVSLVSWFQEAAPWIDLSTAQVPLFDTDPLVGEEWAQLAVSSLIWIVVPFVVGLLRVLRSEMK